MKIKITEYITEIDADARELRESNTLGGKPWNDDGESVPEPRTVRG